MAGTSPASAGAAPGPWQSATVEEVRRETARAKTFRLRLSQPSPYLAGQHFIVRLTAPDGYTASRSYSVASAPDGSGRIELTVERLEDGEVSTFLRRRGRCPATSSRCAGPIGGYFVWRGDTPALLVGGGSGVVPLMAMLRLASQTGRSDLVRLVVSARTPDDLYYAKELPGPERRSSSPARRRPPGRGRPGASTRRISGARSWRGAGRLCAGRLVSLIM